jgi:hypothetical protein
MKAYFAVGDGRTAQRLLSGHRALMSFAYIGTSWLPLKEAIAVAAVATGVMLDSGAFTAWKQGRPISLGAYADWLTEDHFPRDHALSLDVIGDADASMRNFRQLSELVTGIVPVWHEGDPLEHLDEYVARSPLVALGRLAARASEQKTLEFYDAAFNRHEAHRFHALGNGRPTTLERYPFDSFDATSWQRDAAYSNAARWPFNRCTKETRMRAHIEATETMEFVPSKQMHLWGAA